MINEKIGHWDTTGDKLKILQRRGIKPVFRKAIGMMLCDSKHVKTYCEKYDLCTVTVLQWMNGSRTDAKISTLNRYLKPLGYEVGIVKIKHDDDQE